MGLECVVVRMPAPVSLRRWVYGSSEMEVNENETYASPRLGLSELANENENENDIVATGMRELRRAATTSGVARAVHARRAKVSTMESSFLAEEKQSTVSI